MEKLWTSTEIPLEDSGWSNMIPYSVIYNFECCEYDELTRDDLLLLCDWYKNGSPEAEVNYDRHR